MAKKRKDRKDIVYSTNSNFDYEYEEEEEEESISPSRQKLYVSIDRKGRKGKVVTLVTGFTGPSGELEELGKKLKSSCGTGGSVKDAEIIIQGEFRERVFELLKKEGFGVKKKG